MSTGLWPTHFFLAGRSAPYAEKASHAKHTCRYRGEYEAVRAWHSEAPEENIQRARAALDDMRLVLQAQDHDEVYQDARLRPLLNMIEAAEQALEEEYVGQYLHRLSLAYRANRDQ